MSDFETLELRRDGAVLTIAFNRPDRLNALTPQVADELRAALVLAEEADVRAVVLTGNGRGFSSGADLKDGTRPTTDDGFPDLAASLRNHFNWPVRGIRALPKPVIAAVNGPAVGVAVSYALACDFVVAARSSYLLLSFLNIGLVPDGGASALISARAGWSRFNELAMLAEKIPADTALQYGLVDRVEDDENALPAALALAARLAEGPTSAQAAVKRMVNEGPLRHLEDALELEAELQGVRGRSPEFFEGVSAFLQKRKPDFTGVPV